MSHISFYTPSLPAGHFLFVHVFGGHKTRHALERARGEEWVDFISDDMMGSDQVSVHLDPMAKTREPAHTIADIQNDALGKRDLLRCLTGAPTAGAVVGAVQAPMPHWGPVYDSDNFDRVLIRLREIGLGDDIVRAQTHHAGRAAEHRTLFLTLGNAHFEVKGYRHPSAITAALLD